MASYKKYETKDGVFSRILNKGPETIRVKSIWGGSGEILEPGEHIDYPFKEAPRKIYVLRPDGTKFELCVQHTRT